VTHLFVEGHKELWMTTMLRGDLVVCRCKTDVWYKGMVGMLIGFDRFGVFNRTVGDPVVMYPGGKKMRLCLSGLELFERMGPKK